MRWTELNTYTQRGKCLGSQARAHSAPCFLGSCLPCSHLPPPLSHPQETCKKHRFPHSASGENSQLDCGVTTQDRQACTRPQFSGGSRRRASPNTGPETRSGSSPSLKGCGVGSRQPSQPLSGRLTSRSVISKPRPREAGLSSRQTGMAKGCFSNREGTESQASSYWASFLWSLVSKLSLGPRGRAPILCLSISLEFSTAAASAPRHPSLGRIPGSLRLPFLHHTSFPPPALRPRPRPARSPH